MITDDLLLFSSSQSLVGAAATTVSTNTEDLQQNRDQGLGTDLQIVTTVDIAFTGGTSLQVQAIISATSNLASPTVLGAGRVIPEALLVAGYMTSFSVPELNKGDSPLRYFGVQYVTLGTHTTGAVTTRIVLDRQNQRDYASGFSVA